MNWIKTHKILSGIIAFFVLIVVITAAAGGDSKKKADNSNASTPATTQQQTTQPQQNQTPTPKPDYDLKDTEDLTYLRQERHFVWNKDKPTVAVTKDTMLKLKKTCPDDKICDLMLWDSEAAYKARNNSSNLSSEYSVNNKEHLIGYLNSGGLFYYYGGGEVYLSE